VEVQLYSFFNLGARCVGWSTPRPGRIPPGKQTRYPFYRRLGASQGRSGRVANNLAPSEIGSPDYPSRSVVTILTELYGLLQ
jgi:hypothetical protein